LDIVFYIGLALFVLFGPWIFVWRGHVHRKRERAEDQARWRDLTNRIYVLEQAARKAAENPAARPVTIEAAPLTEAVAEPTTPPDAVNIEPAAPQRAEPTTVEAQPFRLPASPAPPPPQFTPVRTSSLFDRFHSSLDLEETLGTNWLNKLGISILVLGIAFFLAYQLKTLGPGGKVLIGYATSVAALGAGIWFERGERYRALARAGIGGGWALLFFTTYALYHVPAARVLSSQPLDLVLMLAVAAAMVWHTLRYHSQVVTGLTFLLAFLTVTVSHDNVYSLSAGTVLAAALVVIVGYRQWFELEIFGILASYLNHYLWLRPIIEPMHGHRHPFPEFAASASILLTYWAIFRLSYLFRHPSEAKERISTIAALLNTVLLLALFKYQSAHPEWAFWALLAIGAAETTLGQLPFTRKRRTAVIVLSTIGVVLLIAAFPFRYSGARLSVLWLFEAEALLLIGVWTREIVFRRIGLLAIVLVNGQMVAFDAARVYGIRMDGAIMRAEFRLALLFAVAAAVSYADAHWVFRRWKDFFAVEFDRQLMERLSYVGALMAALALWAAFPDTWTAVAWATLGLALALSAHRFEIRALAHQAHALAAASVIRGLMINLESSATFHGISLRLITLSLVIGALYVTAGWSWRSDWGDSALFSSVRGWTNGAYTFAASLIFALLVWYELRSVGVAVAWVCGGLLLLEFALRYGNLALRSQAYLLFAAGFTRIFFVNLDASGSPGELSPRFYTIVPIALAFFYGYWRLQQDHGRLVNFERKVRAPELHCWLGTVSLAALMRFELEPDWVAAAWAALAFALLAIAWRCKLRLFLGQAVLLAFAVFVRASLHNLYQRSYFPAPPWESRIVCVGAVVALLFAALPVCFRLRQTTETASQRIITKFLHFLNTRPEQVFFFIGLVLLTILLALEMRHGMVTVAWGLEAVIVFLFALWAAERSFRLSALGLLLLCVGKILLVDVWRLNPRDRYLTFIVLGAALLMVSFLYTRNREAIRQYL